VVVLPDLGAGRRPALPRVALRTFGWASFLNSDRVTSLLELYHTARSLVTAFKVKGRCAERVLSNLGTLGVAR
jgi:hypothetical protein